VCAFLNQGVFFVYIILIVFMMNYLVDYHIKISSNNKTADNRTVISVEQVNNPCVLSSLCTGFFSH